MGESVFSLQIWGRMSFFQTSREWKVITLKNNNN